MGTIEIVDVTDEARFGLIPPCANHGFDHRTCDYWEDADHGSKAARQSWPGISASTRGASVTASAPNPLAAASTADSNPFAPVKRPDPNPFAPAVRAGSNPFAPPPARTAPNPFLEGRDDPPADNPFVPRKPARPVVGPEAPRKLQLLGRGLGVFGSYAKVLIEDGEAAAYCQFGPLSAYPRALRLRDLYPRLPQAPLPAVITCIATTSVVRHRGLAARLVEAVCEDLAARGFSAVEAYPEAHAPEDATPAARPDFWLAAGFRLAVDDERYPVMRREL
jgi:hypothetical protein